MRRVFPLLFPSGVHWGTQFWASPMLTSAIKSCRHCGAEVRVRSRIPRGLCRVCYNSPIRGQYPCSPYYSNTFGAHKGGNALLSALRQCRHCGGETSLRKRGLCRPCYYDPAIRAQYSVSRFYCNAFGAHRGAGQGNPAGVLPDQPTKFPPGSPGKEAVLMERASKGLCLFHPDDCLGDAN